MYIVDELYTITYFRRIRLNWIVQLVIHELSQRNTDKTMNTWRTLLSLHVIAAATLFPVGMFELLIALFIPDSSYVVYGFMILFNQYIVFVITI